MLLFGYPSYLKIWQNPEKKISNNFFMSPRTIQQPHAKKNLPPERQQDTHTHTLVPPYKTRSRSREKTRSRGNVDPTASAAAAASKPPRHLRRLLSTDFVKTARPADVFATVCSASQRGGHPVDIGCAWNPGLGGCRRERRPDDAIWRAYVIIRAC